jgi:hypothetical protein
MQATATAACEMPQACSNREGPRHPRRRRATGWLRRAGLWNSSRFMILLKYSGSSFVSFVCGVRVFRQ